MNGIDNTYISDVAYLDSCDRAKDALIYVNIAITTIILIGSVLAYLVCKGFVHVPINTLGSNLDPSFLYLLIGMAAGLTPLTLAITFAHVKGYSNRTFTREELGKTDFVEQIAKTHLSKKLKSGEYLADTYAFEDQLAYVLVIKHEEILFLAFKDKIYREQYISQHLQAFTDSKQLLDSSVPSFWLQKVEKEGLIPTTDFEYSEGNYSDDRGSVRAIFTKDANYYFKTETVRSQLLTGRLAHLLNAASINATIERKCPKDISMGGYRTYSIEVSSIPLFVVSYKSIDCQLYSFYSTDPNVRDDEVKTLNGKYTHQDTIILESSNILDKLKLQDIFEKNKDFWPETHVINGREHYFVFYKNGDAIEGFYSPTLQKQEAFYAQLNGRNMKETLTKQCFPEKLSRDLITQSLSEDKIDKAKEVTLENEYILFPKLETQSDQFPVIQVAILHKKSEDGTDVFIFKVAPTSFSLSALLSGEYADAAYRADIQGRIAELAIQAVVQEKSTEDEAMEGEKGGNKSSNFYFFWDLQDISYYISYINGKFFRKHVTLEETENFLQELEKNNCLEVASKWYDLEWTDEELQFLKDRFNFEQVGSLPLNGTAKGDSFDGLVPISWLAIQQMEPPCEPTVRFFKTSVSRDQFFDQTFSGYGSKEEDLS